MQFYSHTELLADKTSGQLRPELADELYQTWVELEQRGLKKTPEYRNVMLRVDTHASWLAGLVKACAQAKRETAGSAAALAARCRNCLLWREFGFDMCQPR